ncbi:unnamed protein product [Lymnaea stagnalis]|uniref:Uncharacterized protein n=1 Tax=Lymnaea stagnalis TaxID=6523 RepID=A0AAV2IQ38_LYMST
MAQLRGSNAYVVKVHTGNGFKTLTGDVNVVIKLYDDLNHSSEKIHLKTDLDEKAPCTFTIPGRDTKQLNNKGKISMIEFWRDSLELYNDRYLDKIEVDNVKTKETFVFPVFRWVKPNTCYQVRHLDTSLPQYDDDAQQEQRRTEIEERRKEYVLDQKFPNGPIQVKQLPRIEDFSCKHKLTLIYFRARLEIMKYLDNIFSGPWHSIEDRLNVYSDIGFPVPKNAEAWKEDVNFAMQRVASVNTSLIKLMTSVPEKFPVTDKILSPLLQGLSVRDAIKQKRLFVCDLEILDGLPVKDNFTLCAPIGLFFMDDSSQLKPVAIQLFQEPGPDNPIFTPGCNVWTWNMVKMWYNNAESFYHQSLTHLGLTHLMMESFALATERNLSVSHPVYKLLKPHFLDLMAINNLAITTLINDGGWIDRVTNAGHKGLHAVIVKRLETWKLDIDGILPQDLKKRGLDDPSVLPCYHYREDATLLYSAINRYVCDYLQLYYRAPKDLSGDYEIQSFVQELVKEKDYAKGGMGIKGLPGNGALTNLDQLQQICTSVIYISSVAHAATNFPQYDEYGFPPKWPLLFSGKPPTNPEVILQEGDLMKCLPDKATTLAIMEITKLLSTSPTKSLGDFETQYIFDPKALEILDRFRQELIDIGKTIGARNAKRMFPYTYLDPVEIPNSISI